MTTAISDFTKLMRDLGDPDTLRTGEGPAIRPRSNAHVHLPPNFSAFETARQAVELADVQGVGILGASNYYDYSVYGELAERATARGIFPLFGLEIIALVEGLVRDGVKVNDPGNPGKYYLCGKGITRFDPMPEEARALLQVIRDAFTVRSLAK